MANAEGRLVADGLSRYGIDISAAEWLDSGGMPVSSVLVSKQSGSRTITHFRDLPEYSVAAFTAIDLQQYDWLHFEGRNIGYTGDSAFEPTSLEKLLTADILITEASSSGFSIPHHTSLEELFSIKVPDNLKIYLSHIGQSVLDKSDQIIHPFYIPNDGMEVEL